MKTVVLEVRSFDETLGDTGLDVPANPPCRFAVHSDITALAAAGIVDRDDRGRVEFPFDAVKVEFLLQAA